MKNNVYNAKDVKDTCETKLGIDFNTRSRKSKEYNGWVFIHGKKATRITVPKGRKYLPAGTYGNMAKQLRIKNSEFDDFLDCPLTGDEVKQFIKNRPSPYSN